MTSRRCGVLDPRIEWKPSRQFPEQKVYRGFDGVTEHLNALWEDFSELRFEPEKVIQGDDVAVVVGRLHSRGRASGAQAGYRFGHLWRVRDGKGVRVEIYLDPEEALAAAGLR